MFSRRLKGQSIIEFSIVAGFLLLLIFLALSLFLLIFQNFALSSAVESQGQDIITTGEFDQNILLNAAVGVGVPVDSGDILSIKVVSPDGVLKSPYSWGDGSSFSVAYGDLVSIEFSKSLEIPGLAAEIGRFLPFGTSWSGVSQRNTPYTIPNIVPAESIGKLSGTVRDISSRDLIAGATVTLSGGGTTSTDALGQYSFDSLAPATYTVAVTKGNYQNDTSPSVIIFQDSWSQDFYLQPLPPTYAAMVGGTSGLIGYWRLGETSGSVAVDQRGTTNGTYLNAPTLGAAGALTGDSDKAVTLNGSNQSVNVAYTGAITGSYSVEAWVKPTSATVPIAIFGARSKENTFDLKLMSGNRIHSDIGTGSAWLNTLADATFAYSVNTWYHIVEVVTPTGYTIYVNGAAVGSGTYTGTPMLTDGTNPLVIGSNGQFSEYFAGSIDEMAVYNRALTGAEVAAHYSSTPPPALPYATVVSSTTGLTGYWRLGETSGSVAVDQRGTTNGTYLNAPTLGAAGALVGDSDTAVTFNGSSQSVNVPYASAITGSYSVEAWVKPTSATTPIAIFGARSKNTTFDIKLMSGNRIHSDIGNGSAWINTLADATFAYAINTWYHIVEVVTPTGYTIYANGAPVGSGAYTGTPMLTDGTNPLVIGSNGQDLAEAFAGSIDEMAVYNRALTGAEVTAHYDSR